MPIRQFHLDLASDPPLWSSNDEQFWQPVKGFFGLQAVTRHRGWLKRTRGAKSDKPSRKDTRRR